MSVCLVDGRFVSKIHLKQPKFTNSASGQFRRCIFYILDFIHVIYYIICYSYYIRFDKKSSVKGLFVLKIKQIINQLMNQTS